MVGYPDGEGGDLPSARKVPLWNLISHLLPTEKEGFEPSRRY